MSLPTIIRGAGLMIEANAVIAMTKGDPMLETGEHRISMATQSRILRFELETGNSTLWLAPSEEEVDRVMSEIAAVRMGTAPLPVWEVGIRIATFDTDDNKWKEDTNILHVEAETSDGAAELVKAGLPGNTMQTRYSLTHVKRVES